MWNSYLGKRLLAFKYAARGAWILLKTEASIQVQAVIALIITAAGFYFEISATEWMLQILAIVMVMSAEGLNSAVEALADFIHPEQDRRIGTIKDIAAGAVFLTAIGAVIVGLIIYIPKF